MKTFKIEVSGTPDKFITNGIVDKFNNQPATKDMIYALDEEIRFIVCDLRLAHGNLNGRSAWLSPRNNDGSFNIRIEF